ncbi:MAG: histidinol-phosphatase [Synergistaceae bacterium]|nr:histidinol-phosphatase [Synergistaceae bacterium]
MILSDFHLHTNFCDGKNDPESIVIEAISRGMKKLGFSGHSHTPFDAGANMSIENTAKYRAEIQRLKEKYRGQIKILCGTEQDYYSDMSTEGYDYVIGSVHYLHINGQYISTDNTPEIFADLIHECNDDPYDMAERYFALVSDVVNKTGADIIGHFDLITKFSEKYTFFDEDNERYIKAALSAVDALIGTGKPFEINTGAISRGWRTTPYPSRRILEHIASRGGRVILSSDAHDKRNLMYKFNECEELARSLGLEIVEL